MDGSWQSKSGEPKPMTENTCVTRDALVDFLYGEADAETHRRVEAHLARCVSCSEELRALNDVRGTLESWVPPEVPLGFRVASSAGVASGPSRWGWFRRSRYLGWAAAAVLVRAAGVVVVTKPEVQIEQGGMVVRIGWADAATAPASPSVDIPSGDPVVGTVPARELQIRREVPVASGQRSLDRRQLHGETSVGAVAGGDAWQQSMLEVITEMERTFAEVDVVEAARVRERLLEDMRRVSVR